MSPSPRETAQVHLAETERKTVSVEAHKLFLDSLLTTADYDEIDELVEQLRAAEFEEKGSQP